MTKRRPLALSAAVTIGFGSLFFASPALAEDTDIENTTEQAQEAPDFSAVETAEAFVAETGGEVVAAGTNSGEGIVIVADQDQRTDEVIEFAESVENGEVDGVQQVLFAEKAIAYAQTDVVGGAGYIHYPEGGIGACSLGFAAWSPQGDPAFLSAGHCTNDGTIGPVEQSKPSTEPAVEGEGYESLGTGTLGTVGFSQFGGPGNTPGAENDPTSTDISVIDVTSDSLNVLPKVTDWETAPSDDLAASAVNITGVADPVAGDVAKSGRTTGYTSGDTSVLAFLDVDGNLVEGEILDGWMEISGRWVHGFISDPKAGPGDSGGAVIQGDTAVGLVSGGPDPEESDVTYLWSTRLQDALQYTGGYEVALHIDAPVVDTPAEGDTILPGATISGTAAGATSVDVGTDGAGEEVSVDDGAWSTTAPTEEGTYTYTFTSVNGFDRSETVEITFTVDAAAIGAPTIDDASVVTGTTTGDVQLTGTGVPGAEIALTGAVDASTTVDADGNWISLAELEIGEHTVTATQSLDGETSPEATATATVSPEAPDVTSIEPDSTIDFDDAPSTISGTGIDGATVTVSLSGGADTLTAVVENGEWTVDLGSQIGAGEYTLTVSQSMNDVTSSEASMEFTVAAAPSEPEAPTDPENPGEGDEGNDDDLANTGSSALLPFGIAAASMLLLGGAVTLFMARRQKNCTL